MARRDAGLDLIVRSMSDHLAVTQAAARWFVKQFGRDKFGWNAQYGTFGWEMPDEVREESYRDLGRDAGTQ